MTALEDAARTYCAAYTAKEQADAAGLMAALHAHELALHDLLLMAGYPCSFCGDGYCAGV